MEHDFERSEEMLRVNTGNPCSLSRAGLMPGSVLSRGRDRHVDHREPVVTASLRRPQ